MPLEPIRRSAELIDYLEQHEPSSTEMLIPVLAHGLGRRTNRAWWVRSPDGTRVGAAVLERISIGIWGGHLLLEDTACAAEVGRFFQRNGARTVWGPASSVEPILPFLPRVAKSTRLWFSATPVAQTLTREIAAEDPDVTIRNATLADLEELEALLANYELYGGLGRRRLRGMLRPEVSAGGLAVAVIDGRIVAAVSMSLRTRKYALISFMTVLPEFRGRRFGAALTAWQSLREAQAGRGWCGKIAVSNGMRPGPLRENAGHEVFTDVNLGPRVRFRGQRKLRAALRRLEGPPTTPRLANRSPYTWVPESEGRDS